MTSASHVEDAIAGRASPSFAYQSHSIFSLKMVSLPVGADSVPVAACLPGFGTPLPESGSREQRLERSREMFDFGNKGVLVCETGQEFPIGRRDLSFPRLFFLIRRCAKYAP